MIVIVDYGAGNLRSVQKALESQGYEAHITSEPERVRSAGGIILPGVGAAAGIMGGLRRQGLVEPIREAVRNGTPYLGICMGLQVLFTKSDEGGGEECLDIIPGRVRKLPEGIKIPHMGWNSVRQISAHPLWRGVDDDSYFYFVHSYFVDPVDRSAVIGATEYGISFASAVARGHIMGVQFHPEKSGGRGLGIYGNFAKLVRDEVSGNPSR